MALLPSCGGGGGSTSASSSGTIGFTVQDAPSDSFSVARIRLTSLKLITADAAVSTNLLEAPREFDFLGLSARQALLAMVSGLPLETYAEMELTADLVTALDLDGDTVPVTLRTGSARVVFGNGAADPLALEGDFAPCAIDIDLDRSFTEDPLTPGSYFFDLTFRATPSPAPLLEEFRATVASVDAAGNRFTAQLIDDSAPTLDFGLVSVVVADGDVLANDDGDFFSTAAAFLAELEAGDAVQVSGVMQNDGDFDADRVIEEDDDTSGNSRVEIEGEVRSVVAGQSTFEVLVKEVEKGSSIADPVLSALPDPNLIVVSWDAATLILAEDSEDSGTGLVDSSVFVGMEVDLRFADFSGSGPFYATSIEIGDGHRDTDDGVEFEGFVSAVDNLPTSFTFTFTIDEADPIRSTGTVTADVQVPLAAAESLILDAGPEPTLTSDDLVPGLRMEIHGDISGTPSDATLTPSTIEVKPGVLKGELVAVDLFLRTITIEVDEVERAFGDIEDPSGQVELAVHAQCSIETEAGGHALVDLNGAMNLGPVEVEVKGIADDSGEITLWEIEED